MHSCQVRSVFARRPLLIRPSVPGFPGRDCCRGIIQAPWGKVRGGRLCPHQGVFVPVSRAGGGPSWRSQASRRTPMFVLRASEQRPRPFHLAASFLLPLHEAVAALPYTHTHSYDTSSPTASRFMSSFFFLPSFPSLTSGCLGTSFVRGRHSLICLFDVALIVQPPRSV